METEQPQPAIKMIEKKGDMTATAEKLYAIYDKARAAYRAAQKETEIEVVHASDTKKDD